jgi:hypothetical protein
VKYYSDQMMQTVLENRGMTSPTSRMASTPWCKNIKKWTLATINGSEPTWFYIIDCSNPEPYWRKDGTFRSDQEVHLAEGLYLEVDYQSYEDFFTPGDGRENVTIWCISTTKEC